MDFYRSISRLYDCIFPFSALQYRFIMQHLQEPETSSLLEIGCGTGSLTLELSQTCLHVSGIDLDESMIDLAHEKQHRYEKRAQLRAMDMLDIDSAFTDQSFDVIFSFGNTLVHLTSTQNMLDVLTSSKKLLRPDGSLLLQMINYDRILTNRITSLPVIDNRYITFERSYEYLTEAHLIKFTTRLTDKSTGDISHQQVQLYPLVQAELETLLHEAGFTELNWYGGFDLSPLTEKSVPLIVSAV